MEPPPPLVHHQTEMNETNENLEEKQKVSHLFTVIRFVHRSGPHMLWFMLRRLVRGVANKRIFRLFSGCTVFLGKSNILIARFAIEFLK